ncbi:hypothetical protein EDC65_0315 [Stella humosa]|uniref:Uncharacterized protein n=1 Tax=Stella humosa TaxID=94 RepID=A0A3N1MC05_9PROT|nr:hypothetical protein [Stella humosa]ROQ01138.1 hypothetical protein EDC65_0315 [Stella humosa]BBK31512.1 hypothetical protein STHU_21460 [Stella humosa]
MSSARDWVVAAPASEMPAREIVRRVREDARQPVTAPPTTTYNVAQQIAADLSLTIRETIAAAAPHGRRVGIDVDIAHEGILGGRTAGRVRIWVGGSE